MSSIDPQRCSLRTQCPSPLFVACADTKALPFTQVHSTSLWIHCLPGTDSIYTKGGPSKEQVSCVHTFRGIRGSYRIVPRLYYGGDLEQILSEIRRENSPAFQRSAAKLLARRASSFTQENEIGLKDRGSPENEGSALSMILPPTRGQYKFVFGQASWVPGMYISKHIIVYFALIPWFL